MPAGSFCCRQAIETVIKDVLPQILKLMPEHLLETFRINVVGANVVPDDIRQLLEEHSDYVEFHGHLSDEQVRIERPPRRGCK